MIPQTLPTKAQPIAPETWLVPTLAATRAVVASSLPTGW